MNNKLLSFVVVALVFCAGVAGTYLVLTKFPPGEKQAVLPGGANGLPSVAEDLVTIKLLCPQGEKLAMTERKLARRSTNMGIVETVVAEFFRDPAAAAPSMPPNVKLLGAYMDNRQMLYVDLSDELRRGFQGDALAEYLLLKGLYESLLMNVPDMKDLKVLVDGKEIDSLGGHFLLKFPLRSFVAVAPSGEKQPRNE